MKNLPFKIEDAPNHVGAMARLTPDKIAEYADRLLAMLDDLHQEDRLRVLVAAKLADANPENIEAFARYKIMQSLDKEYPDPRVLDLAIEAGREKTADEWMDNLSIEIVPYTIRDSSLSKIAQACSEEPYTELLKAVAARAHDQYREEPQIVKRAYLKLYKTLAEKVQHKTNAADDTGDN